MPHVESALLKWAFQHSSDGMILTDPHGVIRMANEAFINMFGYPREEVIGFRTGFLRSQYSLPAFYDAMWKSIRERGEWHGEIVNQTKGGDEKTCFLTISSIIAEDGERLGYLGLEIDLTERKRFETQIIQGEKLAAIGESVATLAHEIRNPLNGIAMNIYLLQSGADDHWTSEERESIELISRETKRLDTLVKNVLTNARTIELDYETVIVSDFLRELEELLVFQARDQNVRMNVEISSEEFTGRFDRDQMKQVMLNLIQNAIEATAWLSKIYAAAHAGSDGSQDQRLVRVSASLKEDPSWRTVSSTAKVLVFTIENSGPAISPAVRAKLFQPFFTTKTQGLGLGLATSVKIVRQHHGIVDIESAHTPYTTSFTVAIPA